MNKLDILIPAFCYPEGIERILGTLCPIPPGVNVIISDGTPDDSVQLVVQKFRDPRLNYLKNVPTHGPAANWNFLFDNAVSDYVMLLHHDEVPLGKEFLAHLLNNISASNSDVFMLGVIILNHDLSVRRTHVPNLLRQLVVRWYPAYLFRRNVIGPTGALVVRRSVLPKFRNDILWFLDVDFYYRLRMATSNWNAVSTLSIGSIQDAHVSLTKTIKPEISQISKAEKGILSTSYPDAKFWLLISENFLLAAVELLGWAMFRALQLLYTTFSKIFFK